MQKVGNEGVELLKKQRQKRDGCCNKGTDRGYLSPYFAPNPDKMNYKKIMVLL